MKRSDSFINCADRYIFDFGECSNKNGYAQIDTDQDASYYGHWANPTELKFVGYCEGDITRIEFDNPQEFANYIRKFCEQAARYNGKTAKIDPGYNRAVIDGFNKLGMGDLLH